MKLFLMNSLIWWLMRWTCLWRTPPFVLCLPYVCWDRLQTSTILIRMSSYGWMDGRCFSISQLFVVGVNILGLNPQTLMRSEMRSDFICSCITFGTGSNLICPELTDKNKSQRKWEVDCQHTFILIKHSHPHRPVQKAPTIKIAFATVIARRAN